MVAEKMTTQLPGVPTVVTTVVPRKYCRVEKVTVTDEDRDGRDDSCRPIAMV